MNKFRSMKSKMLSQPQYNNSITQKMKGREWVLEYLYPNQQDHWQQKPPSLFQIKHFAFSSTRGGRSSNQKLAWMSSSCIGIQDQYSQRMKHTHQWRKLFCKWTKSSYEIQQTFERHWTKVEQRYIGKSLLETILRHNKIWLPFSSCNNKFILKTEVKGYGKKHATI